MSKFIFLGQFIYGVCICGCVRLEEMGCYICTYINMNICEHELIYVRPTLARSNKENLTIKIMLSFDFQDV